MKLNSKVKFLLLGWLLGLLSPLIVDNIKKQSQKKELRFGILAELNDTRARLTSRVNLIALRKGTYDKELIKWLLPIYKELNETIRKDKFPIKLLEDQLKWSDEQISIWNKEDENKGGQGITLKPTALSFLETRFGALSLFASDFQNKTIDIKARVDFVNKEIDLLWFYFEKMFDFSLTEENRKLINTNIDISYSTISDMSRNIVDRINKILSEYN